MSELRCSRDGVELSICVGNSASGIVGVGTGGATRSFVSCGVYFLMIWPQHSCLYPGF